jgi:hypothetical protein
MGFDDRSKSSGLIRGAIAFVYSRVRGKRFAEMLAALALMLVVAAIVLVPPEVLGQIVTKSTYSELASKEGGLFRNLVEKEKLDRELTT